MHSDNPKDGGPTDPILEDWASCPTHSSETLVFPDGCRDVIFVRQPAEGWRWFVTELDDRARSVPVCAGAEYIGRRLRPGVIVDFSALAGALRDVTPENVEDGRIAECCQWDTKAHEILAALAQSADAQSAAGLLGTSLRTLQRTTLTLTGRSPLYWTRLARARRAAAALHAGASSIDTAVQVGFTDQSHMTREFRHWFSVTPGQVRRLDPIVAGIHESGFASTSP